MTWQQWTVCALLAWGSLLTIANIGKPRKPIDPSLAVAVLILNGALIALVVTG